MTSEERVCRVSGMLTIGFSRRRWGETAPMVEALSRPDLELLRDPPCPLVSTGVTFLRRSNVAAEEGPSGRPLALLTSGDSDVKESIERRGYLDHDRHDRGGGVLRFR